MSQLASALGPNEHRIVGAWHAGPHGMKADANCARIEQLMLNHLVRLATDVTGWDCLYRDPSDGRLWELTYPLSDGHGGGPPTLAVINTTTAKGKYGTPGDI